MHSQVKSGDRTLEPGNGRDAPLRRWRASDTVFAQFPAASSGQWDNMKVQLDLTLLALETLADIGSEDILQAASELDLGDLMGDRVSLWRLRQSSPLRKGKGGRKRLDVEEARGLVLIVCHLAQLHQELIRRAIALMEQMSLEHQPPHHCQLLGDYIDGFTNCFQERMEAAAPSTDLLEQLALKLLIDLLFYSAPDGHERFWLALLGGSH